MADDLLAVARRHLRARPGADERNDRDEQTPPAGAADLSSSPSFPSSPAPDDGVGWGSLLAAVRRMLDEADGWVEAAGVSGTHPSVSAAAAAVASAVLAGDFETVRFAVSEFRVVVRELAGGRPDPG